MSHDATEQPSSIYVWLVRSEEVLEQPGSWRIRKWDTEPFPEANYTASALSEIRLTPPQRYEFTEHGHYNDEIYHSMDDNEHGDYVKWDDVKHLFSDER